MPPLLFLRRYSIIYHPKYVAYRTVWLAWRKICWNQGLHGAQEKAKAAIRALELFFADSLQRGELSDSGDKVCLAAVVPPSSKRKPPPLD